MAFRRRPARGKTEEGWKGQKFQARYGCSARVPRAPRASAPKPVVQSVSGLEERGLHRVAAQLNAQLMLVLGVEDGV